MRRRWGLVAGIAALGATGAALEARRRRRPTVAHMERAAGVAPRLVVYLEALALEGERHGIRYVIAHHGGVRDDAGQLELYGRGVTNARTTRDTAHGVKVDGYGHGVDVVPYRRNAAGLWAPDYTDRDGARIAGELAERMGLVWGGRWSSIDDPWHVETPDWRSLPPLGVA